MPEKQKPSHRSGKQADASSRGAQKSSLAADLGPVSGQGRSGGRLARKIATEDELKRAFERPAGATRPRKSDEAE